jgi:hypothetical protein
MRVLAVLNYDGDLSDHEEDVSHKEHHEEGVELHESFLDDLENETHCIMLQSATGSISRIAGVLL